MSYFIIARNLNSSKCHLNDNIIDDPAPPLLAVLSVVHRRRITLPTISKQNQKLIQSQLLFTPCSPRSSSTTEEAQCLFSANNLTSPRRWHVQLLLMFAHQLLSSSLLIGEYATFYFYCSCMDSYATIRNTHRIAALILSSSRITSQHIGRVIQFASLHHLATLYYLTTQASHPNHINTSMMQLVMRIWLVVFNHCSKTPEYLQSWIPKEG